MATPAEVQAQLSTNPMGARILMATEQLVADTAKASYYAIGGTDAPGRARWVDTTKSDSAAVQAAAILTALRA